MYAQHIRSAKRKDALS